jgi:hypothetical protein
MIGGRVSTASGERDQRLHGRRHGHQLRIGWTTPAHGDHDDTATLRDESCQVPRQRSLPHPLARADDRERGQVEGLEARRIEVEVGSRVRDPVTQDAAGEREPLDRPEDGLVREVDHDLRRVAVDRGLHVRSERDAVVRVPTQLLRAADEDGGHDVVRQVGEGVPDDGRVVLTVDDRERARGHVREVTSSSIAPVYFV